MKILSIVSLLTIFGISSISCKKQPVVKGHQPPEGPRTVQFALYTTEDFSANNTIIIFSLSIQDKFLHSIWDSTLAPMKIKDIPGIEHKFLFKKTINYSGSLLKTGFFYAINDVGRSWHMEAFPAGDTLKLVDFDFQ